MKCPCSEEAKRETRTNLCKLSTMPTKRGFELSWIEEKNERKQELYIPFTFCLLIQQVLAHTHTQRNTLSRRPPAEKKNVTHTRKKQRKDHCRSQKKRCQSFYWKFISNSWGCTGLIAYSRTRVIYTCPLARGNRSSLWFSSKLPRSPLVFATEA